MNSKNQDSDWKAEAESSRHWAESQGQEGAIASWYGEDRSGAELAGAVLSDAILTESVFRRANLAAARLERVQAGGIDLTEATLTGATFDKATLVEACADRSTARGSRWVKADLRRASFVEADLAQADLQGADCTGAVFVGAKLTGGSLWTASCAGADFRRADLSNVRFERTLVDFATRFDEARGLDAADVVSIVVADRALQGQVARDWLAERARPLPWSDRDFLLFLLSEMGGERAQRAAAELCSDDAARAQVTRGVAATFNEARGAVDYERILGTPVRAYTLVAAEPFGESWCREFQLPQFPRVRFCVNQDRDGLPWGVCFEGGRTELPARPEDIAAWEWTATSLKALGTDVEVIEEWNHDLELELTLGGRRFHARFAYGLLQEWVEVGRG